MMRSVRAAVCIAVGLLALSGCYANYTSPSADPDATAQSERMLRTMGAHWDMATFDRMAAPEFYAVTSRSDAQKLLSAFRRKLGPIKSLKLTDSAQRASAGTSGTSTEVRADFDVTFEKGTGDVQIATINRGHGWKIEGFHVNSPMFLQ